VAVPLLGVACATERLEVRLVVSAPMNHGYDVIQRQLPSRIQGKAAVSRTFIDAPPELLIAANSARTASP